MSKNVIVTGGAGYIGSHACKALMKAGYNPITVDCLHTGWEDAVKFGPFEKVDLLDQGALDKIFKKYNPCSIMHFAAFSEVGESVKYPGKYWRNNVVGSLNLIETAVKNGCLDLIFSSTCATYGSHDNVIIKENTPQRPVNSYGTSKHAVEKIIQHFSNSAGLNYVIFRYFNVAGADPDAEIGEFHKPESHLIPRLLDVVAGKQEAITIYGTDYETEDGTCVRDYVHVCDLIDAHLLGFNWLQDGGASKIYNLGTASGFSVREVISSVRAVTKKSIPFIEGPRRPGDCSTLVSGSSLIKKELGWSSKRSNLNQMVGDAWRWHQTGFYGV